MTHRSPSRASLRRAHTLLFAAGVLVTGVLGASTAVLARGPKQTAEPQTINNALSHLCLGVRGVDQHGAGTGVEVYYCNPGEGDRGHDNQWYFERVPGPGDFVQIKNRVSGLCVATPSRDATAGTGVVVSPCASQANGASHWRIVRGTRGFKQIEHRPTELCLGVRGVDGHEPGTDVEVYHCAPRANDPGWDGWWRFQGLD
jgi:hypothetical protein